MGSKKHFSIAYRHESNGILERKHREVYRHMLCLTKQLRKDNKWSLYSPLIQRILNSTIDVKLGLSPAQLLYGNMEQPDRGIIHPYRVKCSTTSVDFITQLLSVQTELLKVSQLYLAKCSDKKANSAAVGTHLYLVGDYVLI